MYLKIVSKNYVQVRIGPGYYECMWSYELSNGDKFFEFRNYDIGDTVIRSDFGRIKRVREKFYLDI